MVKSVIRRNSRSLRHVFRPKGSRRRRRRNKRSKKMRGGGNILTLTTPTHFAGRRVPQEKVKLVKYNDRLFIGKINYIYIVVEDNVRVEYFEWLIDVHFVHEEEAEQYKPGTILNTGEKVTEGEHSNKKKYKYILPNCENVNQQIDKSTSCKDILYKHINNTFKE